jgi:hypothetical protein
LTDFDDQVDGLFLDNKTGAPGLGALLEDGVHVSAYKLGINAPGGARLELNRRGSPAPHPHSRRQVQSTTISISPSDSAYWSTSYDMVANNLVNLTLLPSEQGFEISLSGDENAGISSSLSLGPVSRCGDVNGDGVQDWVVALSETNNNQTGRAFVVYGRERWNDTVVLSELEWGVDGFEVYGVAGEGPFESAAHVGDMNNDSRADLAFGMPRAASTQGADTGAVQVLFGTNFPSAVSSLALGSEHTCGVLAYEAGARCWGSNTYGQLGRCDVSTWGDAANQMGMNLENIKTGPSQKVAGVSAAGEVTCMLFLDGSVSCFGWNSFGQLGMGDNSLCASQRVGNVRRTVNLGTLQTAQSIRAGALHACAILNSTGELKCWGANGVGQLGQGDTQPRGNSPGHMGDNLPAIDLGQYRVLSVSVGLSHTCALLSNGDVKCFGFNDFGQLGLGDFDNRGDDPDEMGAALPPVDLGPATVVQRIVSGLYHTCALLQDKQLKCWGGNG